MPRACAPTSGRVASNVLIAAWLCVFCSLTGAGEPHVELSLPPSRQEPGTRTSSRTTSAVWLARMPCFLNFWPWLRPGVSGGMTKRGVAAPLELGLDGRHDDVDVGDATVRDPGLRAVQHPLVGLLVVDGAGAQARDVAAGVGLAHRERAELDLVGGAEALRHPLPDLLRRAAAMIPLTASVVPRIASVMPASPQASSSLASASIRPGGVGGALREELERVDADLGGLLDDRPRGLLPLVPLVGGGADDVLREVVDPLLELELVLVEVERELGHACLRDVRPVGRTGRDVSDV